MLVAAKALLQHAVANCYAIGAYDILDTTMLEGVLQGAQRAEAPVLISIAEVHTDQFDEATLLAATVEAAATASVPVAIHYDHGTTLDRLVRATQLGYTSLMIDGSHLEWAENVALTRRASELAHAVGLPLEAEVGYVPGEEGKDAELHPGAVRYTEPEEVEAFVTETGCDWLAVSIGTVHGRFRGEPQLDLERLAAIRARLPATPLVIHGGTGLSDEQFRALVAAGANKINYYTALVETAAAAATDSRRWDEQRLAAREAIAAEVERTCRVWGAAGRAEAAGAAAPRIEPVEHVIFFRWAEDAPDVTAMQTDGVATLGALPGVWRIAAGVAETPNASYPYLWTMTFATPEALAHFRTHPEHQHFADNRFRLFAPERITIDFHLTYGNGRCATPKSSRR
ncbi:MAG: class II fructose-bisphosphate aldolase [Hydrogenophilus thermoluteolus]